MVLTFVPSSGLLTGNDDALEKIEKKALKKARDFATRRLGIGTASNVNGSSSPQVLRYPSARD